MTLGALKPYLLANYPNLHLIEVHLGLKVLTPLHPYQKDRTLFCFCTRLDNAQGGVNTFKPKCNASP